MRSTTALIGALLLIPGCTFGRADPADYPDPTTPYGRTVELMVTMGPGDARTSLEGELLWVEADAVVVLARDTVIRVPADRIRRHRVVRGEDSGDILGRPDPPRHFARAARYPAPLDPAQVRALLDALGQDSIRTVGDDYPGHDPGDDPGTAGGAERPAPPPGLDAFLTEARAAAARFERIEAAIAEGYRRLGPSFPGMGEHWVQPGRIVEGRVDPTRPAVLCYVRIDGQPRLTSVAFTRPLGGEEAPPEEPFGRAAWHDHADTVDEESLLLAHPASHHDADGPRLAMVHVWIWPENPDGILAQNNWRLPFAVAGFRVTALDPPVDAARGLSLWTADADYYDTLFRAAADPTPAERKAMRELLEEHRGKAAAWADRRRHSDLEPADLTDVAAVWSSLWDRIETEVGPATWSRLAPLR